MTIARRSLLGWISAGSAAAGTAAAQTPTAAMPVTFQHGVASGDPDQTSAVFWTRVTPGGDGTADVEAELQVARDAGFTNMVRRTQGLRARADRDFTIKHDLDGQGLEPGTEYFYRFIAGGVTSPVGRVKTLPVGPTADVVLAVASCQLHPGGLFNAYDAMSKLERLDAVVHLGDYIYEYGASATDYGMATATRLNRIPQPPHEIVTLADYRLRQPSTSRTRTCRPPMPVRPSSASGTTTRSPTTPSSPGPRTIRPRPRATTPSARRRRSRPITSGCRSGSRAPA